MVLSVRWSLMGQLKEISQIYRKGHSCIAGLFNTVNIWVLSYRVLIKGLTRRMIWVSLKVE
jgi:hypothetical protein